MDPRHGEAPHDRALRRAADARGRESFRLPSYGYDARASREFKIFAAVDSAIVDPKSDLPASFVDRELNVYVAPPNSFALATTIEYSRMPRDVLSSASANRPICAAASPSTKACETFYADRKGKYMHQRGVTLPKL
jgi:dCTP deaminase